MIKRSKYGSIYQVCKRVEFLSHQAGLASPSCNLPIHEVEEHAERCEDQREPDGTIVRWVSEAVSQRGENGHDAAEAIELCNHICEMERSVRGTASVRVNAGVE